MPDHPTVRLLFFSALRDVAGVDAVDWPWPPTSGADATVSGLLGEVYARWPALAVWDGRLLVAVDLDYAARETPLRAGQEVAVMPPVQGG
ncbi:MAG: MoaD/ThiS family protein [Verrucomicrobiales bacterium]